MGKSINPLISKEFMIPIRFSARHGYPAEVLADIFEAVQQLALMGPSKSHIAKR